VAVIPAPFDPGDNNDLFDPAIFDTEAQGADFFEQVATPSPDRIRKSRPRRMVRAR